MRSLFDEAVAEARLSMPWAFATIPEQEVIVHPYPDNVAGTGMAASYQRATGDRPAMFRYDPLTWPDATKGGTSRTALHEGYPGHHMQIDLAHVHPSSAA